MAMDFKPYITRDPSICGGEPAFTSDAQRVGFLFERHQQLTSLLPAEKKTAKRRLKT